MTPVVNEGLHHAAEEKEGSIGSAHSTCLDPQPRAAFTLIQEDLLVLPGLLVLGMTSNSIAI